ncbi:hypothetical protein [Streptomyces sp. NPDC059850]|uniref:hypothetical protein n=1 Tax=Streptomyces sp. NPDC059850 TaxID=3346970 RepID=UPI0036580248
MTTRALPWTPPHSGDVEMIEVGQHWDVVRAPADIGERAVALLGDETGAVIADYGLMYWLIAPGHARTWQRLRRDIHALGAERAGVAYVGVPPAAHTTGPRLHWHIPMGPDRYLTDADRLHEALSRAVSERAEEATTR